MKRIQVLMSTYNCEKYLREQIDSILGQKGVEVSILIRDDGSQDGTVAILKQYSDMYENIRYYTGRNLGVQKSFFNLLRHADGGYDYYAFSDQDDCWFPEKLSVAAKVLGRAKRQDIPLLYGCSIVYASEDMSRVQKVPYRNERPAKLGNALVENIFMGCTEVFNPSLLALAAAYQPKGQHWHDWWLYLTAAAFGQAVYDPRGYMFYRQHGDNCLGMQNSWRARWKNRLEHFKQLRHSLSRQAQEFAEAYGTDYRDGDLVRLLADYRTSAKKRIRAAGQRRLYRQQHMDDRVYHLLFLAGLL